LTCGHAGLQGFFDGAKARKPGLAVDLRRWVQFARNCSKDKPEMLLHRIESRDCFTRYGLKVVQTCVELPDLIL
jgi:hypothetical protein